jgi:hypothetical protein
MGDSGSVIRWGAMLQSRRSTVRDPMSQLDFLNLPNSSSRNYCSGVDSAFNRNEYQESFLEGGVKQGRRIAQPRRHLWADCLGNVGSSTPHNSVGLHDMLHG